MSRFNQKAQQWDSSSIRQSIAQNAYNAIISNIDLDKEDSVLDFGAGTGLLSKKIALHVRELLAVDSSDKMLQKLDELHIKNIQTLHQDISKFQTDKRFNGIVSSMTMHHIKDLDILFDKLYQLLDENGYIAIVDLMSEDGSFHMDNEGVHHFGFSEKDLTKLAKKHNFKDIKYTKIYTVTKENGQYDIFLLSAKK